ncbi:MAG: single-stranded DNA-binding protein [Candidatus Pacebacteria bacterium]|nr:single-stranded DNA-binding protein [Candidatus Paceibacterota bacterium]
MYINRAMILGNLTRDPELKSLPNGTKVVSGSLATNRTYKDQNGEKKEQVEYHNIVAFGKVAELIAQYSKKGASLYVEGRMTTRSWDGTDGQKKYRTEVIIENFQFGPRKDSASTQGVYRKEESSSAKPQSQPKEEDAGLDSIEYPQEESNLEDIPF